MAARPRRIQATPLAPALPGAGRRGRQVKKPRRREKTLRLADLFLWIGSAEACLEHPVGGLERAAGRLGVSTVGVQKCINRLETFLGWRLIEHRKARNPRVDSRQRGGHLSRRAVMFTEVCVCIEHLWSYGMNPEGRLEQELFFVKHWIFSELSVDIKRGLERQKYEKLHELKKHGSIGPGQGRLPRFQRWVLHESRQLHEKQYIDLGTFRREDVPV